MRRDSETVPRLGVIGWDMPLTSGASERSRSPWESGRRLPPAPWRTPTMAPHRRRSRQLGRVRRSGPAPAIPASDSVGRGERTVRIVGDGCAPPMDRSGRHDVQRRQSLRAPTPTIPPWPDPVGRGERTVHSVGDGCAPRWDRSGRHGIQRRPSPRAPVVMRPSRSRPVMSDPALTNRRRRHPHQHRRT